MPSRIVREGINSSPRINELSPMAELFYRRLMTVADDYGRYFAHPATLRGSCWPVCPDRFSDAEIAEWLNECCSGNEPLIVSYNVKGIKYIQISDFKQQIRGKSKFPDCLSIDKHMQSTCEANAQPIRSRIPEAEAEPARAPLNESRWSPRRLIPVHPVPPDAERRVRALAEAAPDQQDFERGIEFAVQQLISAANPESELAAMEANIPQWFEMQIAGKARLKCLRFLIADRDYLRPPRKPQQRPESAPFKPWVDPHAHLEKSKESA